MLVEEVMIHRAGVIVVGFDPLAHGQVILILIIAVFWNDADMFVADLLTQFLVKRAGYQAFAGRGRAGDADYDALVRLVSHTINGLVSNGGVAPVWRLCRGNYRMPGNLTPALANRRSAL